MFIKLGLCFSALLLSGCTLLSGVSGLATGVVDCTVWHVAASGPAGLAYIPLGPFEGAYHGMQLGWYADKASFTGKQGPNVLSLTLPCTTNAALGTFGGKGLSWDMQ